MAVTFVIFCTSCSLIQPPFKYFRGCCRHVHSTSQKNRRSTERLRNLHKVTQLGNHRAGIPSRQSLITLLSHGAESNWRSDSGGDRIRIPAEESWVGFRILLSQTKSLRHQVQDPNFVKWQNQDPGREGALLRSQP